MLHHKRWRFKSTEPKGQLALPIPALRYQDRNFDRGGRSFYFFDFDDNIAFLTTPIYLFEKKTNKEIVLTSGEYSEIHQRVGRPGPYENFEFIYDDSWGSFRNFRDHRISAFEKFIGRKQQAFVRDVRTSLLRPTQEWQGPSWSCFHHAVLNQRPLSLITARGHHPDTIKKGIQHMVKERHLPSAPNYLSVFPVTFPAIRKSLGDEKLEQPVALLKRCAIRTSVERALSEYGHDFPHRFGMSDDDPHNLHLIIDEMTELKKRWPHLSFFVIDSRYGELVKSEILADGPESHPHRVEMNQLSFL